MLDEAFVDFRGGGGARGGAGLQPRAKFVKPYGLGTRVVNKERKFGKLITDS